ncbi:hypothetical protein N9E76_00575 [bacterium]|nr:hypothetical protein [bacterium]
MNCETPTPKVKYLPAMQLSQKVAAAISLYLPTGHNIQTVGEVAPVILEYVPAEQLLQKDAATNSLYFPAMHVLQIWSVEIQYLPAVQLLQEEEAFITLYVPTAHEMQVVTLSTVEYLPMTHFLQSDPDEELSVVEYLPAVQLLQKEEPLNSLYFPIGHDMQVDRSSTEEYLPTTHSWHHDMDLEEYFPAAQLIHVEASREF